MNHPGPNGQQMAELGYSNQVCSTLTEACVFFFFFKEILEEASMEMVELEMGFER